MERQAVSIVLIARARAGGVSSVRIYNEAEG